MRRAKRLVDIGLVWPVFVDHALRLGVPGTIHGIAGRILEIAKPLPLSRWECMV